MENSSKALLITAAVLIVILIVTISIKVLSPAESVVEEANEIAGTISGASKDAVGKLQSALGITTGTQQTENKSEILSKIQIGDKVAYDEGYGKTSTVDPSFKMDDLEWRVLSVESNGTVNLISTQPTTSELTLSGEDGWLNAETNLDKLCNDLYANGKNVKARSLKVEDIDKLAGINTDADKKALNSNYRNLYRYKYDGGIRYSKSTDNGTTWSDYEETGDSKFKKPGELEINSTYNKNKDGTPIVNELKYTDYGYGFNRIKQTTSDGISMSKLLSNGLNGTNNGENNNSVVQWLSSKSLQCELSVRYLVRVIAGGATMTHQQLFSSSGNHTFQPSYCVRPVVSLPASLLGEKIDEVWQVNI